MSSTVLPQAQAKLRRIDFRIAVGLVLFAVGIFATSGIIKQAQKRTPVLVATRSLKPGETLDEGAVRVAEIGLASGVSTLGSEKADSIIGTTVKTSVEAGQILSPGVVKSGPTLNQGEVAISVGVPPAHSVGGSLQAGDRVMVLATDEEQRPGFSTRVLLSEVEVIAINRSEQQGTAPDLIVTLAVSSADAPGIASAANSGVIDLVLLPFEGST